MPYCRHRRKSSATMLIKADRVPTRHASLTQESTTTVNSPSGINRLAAATARENSLFYRVLEDFAKQHLTDPAEIECAVRILRAQGYDETSVLVELLKMFYLDLDEYAEVVRAA